MQRITKLLAVSALVLAMVFPGQASARSGTPWGMVKATKIYGYGYYRITGYFPTGYRTATGSQTYYGELAVDPGTIPLGSWVHIEGLGTFHAEDTGSLVQGRHLDILVYSWSQAYAVQGNGYRKAYWWPGPYKIYG